MLDFPEKGFEYDCLTKVWESMGKWWLACLEASFLTTFSASYKFCNFFLFQGSDRYLGTKKNAKFVASTKSCQKWCLKASKSPFSHWFPYFSQTVIFEPFFRKIKYRLWEDKRTHRQKGQMSPGFDLFWHSKWFCPIFTPADKCFCPSCMKLTYHTQWARYCVQHWVISEYPSWLHYRCSEYFVYRNPLLFR